MSDDLADWVERAFGVRPADTAPFVRALTHSSREGESYERLEFLGDRVLNLIVAERLADLRPEAREGELSRLMNQLVNYHVCAAAARIVGLPDAMRVDASATKVGARDNDRVLGDACEAVIAALYLDGGLEAARAFILTFWGEAFEELDAPRLKDSKTLLQEWAMARGLPVPSYDVIATTGPAHQPRFTIEVRLQGYAPEQGEGGSKREAEKIAADLMLRKREDAL